MVFLNDYEAVKDGFSKDELLGKPLSPHFALFGRATGLSSTILTLELDSKLNLC